VCVARSKVRDRDHLRIEFLRAHQLLELFDSGPRLSDSDLLSLQSFVGIPGASAVYNTTFRLDANSIGVDFETVRLSSDPGYVTVCAGISVKHHQTLPKATRDTTNSIFGLVVLSSIVMLSKFRL